MAKSKPKDIAVSKREGQISAEGGAFFLRNIPVLNLPPSQDAAFWRSFVERQPIAAICRDTIANYLNSLDWKIVARDSTKRDELKAQVKYYTRLLERGNAYYWDIDFPTHIEWFVKDLFTLPFGAACEIGRIDDKPNGRVVWTRPLDAGTLAPTLNFDFPVVQQVPGCPPVYLPKEFVSRVYLSPRTELSREGWGYAPPERIWRAIHMLSTGDEYYAKLLLDTPEAGILDLGDMDKTSAIEWIQGLKDLFYGVSPFKIPVLYEHEKPAQWIPFGRPPSEIMYDSVTMRYAVIVAAGYGLTLSDIGFNSLSNGGETLAGTIRQERVSNRSGKATAKIKFASYVNRILPPTLEFMWIDYDDERNVSKGRARLASAQAANIWIAQKVFLPSEIRQQALADGLVSVDVPETIDPNDPEFENTDTSVSNDKIATGNQTAEVGAKTLPSAGGYGEIIPQQILQRNMTAAQVGVAKSAFATVELLRPPLTNARNALNDVEFELWDEYVDGYLLGKSDIEEERLREIFDTVVGKTQEKLETQSWLAELARSLAEKIVSDVQSRKSLLFDLSFDLSEENLHGINSSPDTEVNPDVQNTQDIAQSVTRALAHAIARETTLTAKGMLAENLGKNLGIDPTETVADNVRVSRNAAEAVVKNIKPIIDRVYQTIFDEVFSSAINSQINPINPINPETDWEANSENNLE